MPTGVVSAVNNRVVAPVLVRVCARAAGLHRQPGLRVVQGLELAPFVAAGHQGVFGQFQVQAHHVQPLVFEAKFARDFLSHRNWRGRVDAVALRCAQSPLNPFNALY